jgi:hypothetical protein
MSGTGAVGHTARASASVVPPVVPGRQGVRTPAVPGRAGAMADSPSGVIQRPGETSGRIAGRGTGRIPRPGQPAAGRARPVGAPDPIVAGRPDVDGAPSARIRPADPDATASGRVRPGVDPDVISSGRVRPLDPGAMPSGRVRPVDPDAMPSGRVRPVDPDAMPSGRVRPGADPGVMPSGRVRPGADPDGMPSGRVRPGFDPDGTVSGRVRPGPDVDPAASGRARPAGPADESGRARPGHGVTGPAAGRARPGATSAAAQVAGTAGLASTGMTPPGSAASAAPPPRLAPGPVSPGHLRSAQAPTSPAPERPGGRPRRGADPDSDPRGFPAASAAAGIDRPAESTRRGTGQLPGRGSARVTGAVPGAAADVPPAAGADRPDEPAAGRGSDLLARIRTERRLRVATLLSLTVIVLAVLPLIFGIRAVGRDPVYSSIDALDVPSWAAQQVQDRTSGSRWCFLDCPLRERTAQSQQAFGPTGKVYSAALARAGWQPWKVSGCPDQPISPQDGVYSCWRRDEFTLDLWVRLPECAVDAVAAQDPATVPSPAPVAPKKCAGSTVSIKVQNAIADTRGRPDDEKPGLTGETPDPVLSNDPLLPTPAPS